MTELFRTDWQLLETPVEQIIHVAFRLGAVSAWHMHRRQIDHFFVVAGTIKVVLYDGRDDSPTKARLQVFDLSPLRIAKVHVGLNDPFRDGLRTGFEPSSVRVSGCSCLLRSRCRTSREGTCSSSTWFTSTYAGSVPGSG